MDERMWLAVLTVAALGAIGCQTRATESAVNGSPPGIDIPVGPPPGPAQKTNLPANPYSGNLVALAEGRQYFVRYNCYGCHGGHGGGGMGPSLRDPDWIYGSADAEVFASIAEGRAHGMPAWGKMIPRGEIWKIVAYVKSLNTNAEPEPPPPFPGPAYTTSVTASASSRSMHNK